MSKYTAKDITVLEGLEPVRRRPSMYIGGVDTKGLHHLIWEIVDNAVDEYLNKYADHITVILDKNTITVVDNGRGIPVDLHPKFKKPAVELILTTLHSGAKFGEGENYVHSGGLHGVGSSVVNALSKNLIINIHRDGFEWEQTYQKGKPITNLKKKSSSSNHGTTISFEPDPEIFKVTEFDSNLIKNHLEDMSYIHGGLTIIFRNENTKELFDLTHSGGIPEFLKQLISKPVVHELPFTQAKNEVEVALQWTESTDESIRSYVNGIRTSSGGTHESGFKNGIAKAIRNYIATHDIKIKGLDISAEDIREGIVGIISVFVREPMFQGQTKEKLNNPEMTTSVSNFVGPALESWLNSNMTIADQIVGRIVLSAKARLASREAISEVKRKSAAKKRLNLPGKLADCKSTNLNESELFIVEGDSAGGSAKQGRNNKTQAVLPLRGKILNSEGLTTNKVLANIELNDVVSAIGTGVGDKFNLKGLRYGKIILLMDADADGHHITTLMLTFFFRHMPELVRKGHVYIAQPPLYRIDAGKETYWVRDDEHKKEILKNLRKNSKVEITRFKGLGEMMPQVLAETTLNPKTRTLLQVEINSNLEADNTFVMLMGKDASQRYKFIMDSATTITELDI